MEKISKRVQPSRKKEKHATSKALQMPTLNLEKRKPPKREGRGNSPLRKERL